MSRAETLCLVPRHACFRSRYSLPCAPPRSLRYPRSLSRLCYLSCVLFLASVWYIVQGHTAYICVYSVVVCAVVVLICHRWRVL
ncbi:uncharacterized protein F5Z01DRAFT_662002 [Emericellopsis atlantica]|uniref:Uncharacterized protein n=1 Tax=Emericellopsis atlantica TaxID=2614577 RepID=A0A9P7ZII1_9HYPO|nr:uncharacterized protein F5Z01DRAFT_662002 [Emericellopsis atlantica]KAG9252108.1 hypothetical protein F5Z01DRAFT_662002 [Emericellopsis atlantica]